MVSLTWRARTSDSAFGMKSEAMPENRIGVAKMFSARRAAIGLARWRLDIPMLRIFARDPLWFTIVNVGEITRDRA